MEKPIDQRPARLHAIGELFSPDKEEDGYGQGHLFCFSLSFSPFSLLYHECNPNPPLGSYKRGGRGEKRGGREQHLEPTSIKTRFHAPPPTRDLRSAPFLEKLVTHTTSTSVQGNTNRSNTY
jgi:hypothetical protein